MLDERRLQRIVRAALAAFWVGAGPAWAVQAAGPQAAQTQPAATTQPSSAPARAPGEYPPLAAYFFWDWNTTDAMIDLLVPALVGHYDTIVPCFVGPRARTERNLKYILARPHPPRVIAGLVAAEKMKDLEDVDGWAELGHLGAWCVKQTGTRELVLDVEWLAHGYVVKSAPLDLDRFRVGLREFATRNHGTEVFVYPPNYEAASDEESMGRVLRRTILHSVITTTLSRPRLIGASYTTKSKLTHCPHSPQYRTLERLWSWGEPVQQVMFMSDRWWSVADLRAALPAIPYECWIYVEPPYTAQTVQRLRAVVRAE